MGGSIDFGLLGRTLGHSYSPQIHAMIGSTPYELVELPDEDDVRAFFKSRQFRGVNVTMPYKLIAYECVDELSDVAQRLGNVNTVVHRADRMLYGDNTDYHGFLSLLEHTLGTRDLTGQTCLVLGSGGASHTVRVALADCGAAEVLVVSRKGALTYETLTANKDLRGRIGLIVNTTPVGMYPHADDALLVDPADYPALRGLVDIVYNPLATHLVQRARELGIPANGGLRMLVSQAIASSDEFLGVKRDSAQLEDQTLAALTRNLATISIIGMPSAGKSSVGISLAQQLGKEFVDVDDVITEYAGMPIPQIFAERGEEGFREIEIICTAQACSKPGRVIATGGGVVTRQANYATLHANGPVILLERGLTDDGEELSSEGRPMSQAKGIARLREERAPLYQAWADARFAPSSDGPKAVAAAIAQWFASYGCESCDGRNKRGGRDEANTDDTSKENR